MDLSVKISNLGRVKAALAMFPNTMTKHTDRAIKKSILQAERESKPLTPVDTGRLRGSYSQTFEPLKGTLEPKTKYAYRVHELPRTRTGQPKYLETGLERSESSINKFFEQALADCLSEIARKA